MDEKAKYWDAIWPVDGSAVVGSHPLEQDLKDVIQQYHLKGTRMLEVGCGVGALQNLSCQYMGTDLSSSSAVYLPPEKFRCCSASALPFPDNSFDFLFSIYVLEHISNPGEALVEMRRVVRPNGIIYLKPAWFCRPWNGRPWHHKQWQQCNPHEKILKSLVKLRNTAASRSVHLLQWRIRGALRRLMRPFGVPLRFKKLDANHQMPLVIDADAECWLDPLDVIKWFKGHGDICLSHQNLREQWLKTAAAVIVRVVKN